MVTIFSLGIISLNHLTARFIILLYYLLYLHPQNPWTSRNRTCDVWLVKVIDDSKLYIRQNNIFFLKTTKTSKFREKWTLYTPTIPYTIYIFMSWKRMHSVAVANVRANGFFDNSYNVTATAPSIKSKIHVNLPVSLLRWLFTGSVSCTVYKRKLKGESVDFHQSPSIRTSHVKNRLAPDLKM